MDERIERNLAYQEAYFAGKFEGIDSKQQEIVLKMHDDNLSLEKISQYSGLDISEIKNIIDSKKEN